MPEKHDETPAPSTPRKPRDHETRDADAKRLAEAKAAQQARTEREGKYIVQHAKGEKLPQGLVDAATYGERSQDARKTMTAATPEPHHVPEGAAAAVDVDAPTERPTNAPQAGARAPGEGAGGAASTGAPAAPARPGRPGRAR